MSDKSDYDCKAPECENISTRSITFPEVGTVWFCDTHHAKASRYKERDELERYCEGPDCGLRLGGEVPLKQKYCSKHCANNAQRVRDGLPAHEQAGPYEAEEQLIREARRLAKERGLEVPPLYRRDSAFYQEMERRYGPGSEPGAA